MSKAPAIELESKKRGASRAESDVVLPSADSDETSSSRDSQHKSDALATEPDDVERDASSDLALRVEALLLTTERAMTASKIAETLELGANAGGSGGGGGGAKAIDIAIARLNALYDGTGRSFRIERIAGGYRMMTRPEFGQAIAAARRRQSSGKLSQAALEALAIVAYRQPITRADIEAIRGVACGEVLRSLLERRLVKITGRAEEVGRPMLYGTTREFLEAFGLSSLKDLPDAKELQSM